MEEQNITTKKWGPSFYKTATITIDNARNQSIMKLTLDIPDKFFIKEGYIYSASSTLTEDELEYYSYSFLEENKMVSITFYYNKMDTNPFQILVVGTDNLQAKPAKRFIYKLTELK